MTSGIVRRGDKGPPAITSVISQLRDWRGRNRGASGHFSNNRTTRYSEPTQPGISETTPWAFISRINSKEIKLTKQMLLLKTKVLLGLLILYWFLIDSTEARRGRTRSRNKSKVQIGLPITGKYRDPESDQYYNNKHGAKIVLASHFDLEYVLGHKIAFLCIAKGTPRPHITWFKDGVEIFAHHYLHIHEWDIGEDRVKSKIEIDPATQMDAGVYECTADNMYSIDRRSFKTDFSIAFD